MTIATDADNDKMVTVLRCSKSALIFMILNFGENAASFQFPDNGVWRMLVNSADRKWGGTETEAAENTVTVTGEVSGKSCRIYERSAE